MTDTAKLKRRLTGISLILVGGLVFLGMAAASQMGLLGRWIGAPMRQFLGIAGFLLPVTVVFAGYWVIRAESMADLAFHATGFILLFLSAEVSLGALPLHPENPWSGEFGVLFSLRAQSLLGLPGTLFTALVMVVVGLWLTRNDEVIHAAAAAPAGAWSWLGGARQSLAEKWAGWRAAATLKKERKTPAPVWFPGRDKTVVSAPVATPAAEPAAEMEAVPTPVTIINHDSVVSGVASVSKGAETSPARLARARRKSAHWILPSMSQLDCTAGRVDEAVAQGHVRMQTTAIEKTLASFKLEGKVVGATVGPRVILYEWQPAPGMKASRLEQYQDDIALSLKAERVRVVVPLPGKGTIGIEVPNPDATGVNFGSILSAVPSPVTAGSLPMFLGRQLTGETMIADLGDMPHMLVAGTTGSGKSVCIHDIIVSLLMTRTPDELRLILIDPKMVELKIYSKVPHLLFEVITDPRRAVAALRWAVDVMENRYKLLSHHTARDIATFNRMYGEGEVKFEGNEMEGRAITSDIGMPWIVIAVDELADLMAAKGREVDTLIQRLAQMARGVGIHLVVATQRPSVDVITGVIKANMPSRIAFRTQSQIDSRTILDSAGAEQLLGKGDMLYMPSGAPDPVRAQGAYITTQEISRVVEHWAGQGAATSVVSGPDGAGAPVLPDADAQEEDPMLKEAVRAVLTSGEASISMLQRHHGLGFARAGRIVDQMERKGIVGPRQGSKPREILVDREEYLRRMDKEERR
jgi:S-DNA-T family DNA segregation ATPase FtsK/SpoIIIE